MTDCKCSCAPCAGCDRKGSDMSKPKIHPRSRWTSTRSDAPAARGGEIVGVALHYPGTPGTIGLESDQATAARLEGYRKQHVDVNGWSDIAYNVAVDQQGNLWTGRGVSRQAGANGTRAANRSRGAILALVGNDEEPSARMIAGILYAVRLWDVRYEGVRWVNPHRKFVPTQCPGEPIIRLLNDGETFYVATARERWPNVK